MKNLFFGLIATVLFSVTGFANNGTNPVNEVKNVESASIDIVLNDSKTAYEFNSVNEFKEYSDSILESLNDEVLTDEPCTITINMSVTVTAEVGAVFASGSASVTVSGSITVGCADAVAAGKRLKAQLLAMAE